MKKKSIKILAAMTCICLGAFALTGCSKDKIDKNAVAATLDDEEIKLDLANFITKFNQAQMETMYGQMFGEDMWNQDLMGNGTTYGESMKMGIMDSLEQMFILENHMEDYSITVTDEEKAAIGKAADEFISTNSKETIETMTASKETVSRMLELYTIQSKMQTAMVADVDTNVTDEEAAQKSISYVLLSTADTTDAEGKSVDLTDEEKEAKKQQAQSILDAAKGGQDLDGAAKAADEKLSASKTSYGSDNTTLDEAVKSAADPLKDGEFAEQVIETDKGYYVVQMVGVFDEAATQSKKDSIVSERKQKEFDDLYGSWKEGVTFTINEKNWAAVNFENSVVIKSKETESQADTKASSETTLETTETGQETKAPETVAK